MSPSPKEKLPGTESDAPETLASVQCALCGHEFNPGSISGNMYCPHCGRRFNPNASADETVAMGFTPVEESSEEESSPTSNTPTELTQPEDGQRIGNYDIIGEVARGGMGVVYRARQRTLKRIVALKVLRGGDGASEEDLLRFMREAESAASLSHPNIVPIHEFDVHKGTHFFTMDYIEGTPLDRVIESGTLTPRESVEYIATIADAIEYAHENGIIHRDLKPANIIIDTQGRPMITDFGLAVDLDNDIESQRMTRSGSVMGTISYIPPEQASGKIEDVDARSDVYSIGAILYEMLTGSPPFEGDTQFELLRRVIHQEPLPPRKLVPRMHPDIETICMRCLEKDPKRRYETADELAEDCRRFLHGEVILARPVTFTYRVWKYAMRHQSQTAAAICVILLAIASASYFRSSTKMKQQLTETQKKARVAEKVVQELSREKAESDKQLKRNWRQEFSCDFSEKADQLWLHSTNTSLNAAKKLLSMNGIMPKKKPRGLVGVQSPFSFDFKINTRVYIPTDAPARPVIFANTRRNFSTSDATLMITIGAPGIPGLKITRGEAILAEDPAYVLEPAVWHEVEITCIEDSVTVDIDGKNMLESRAERIPGKPGEGYLAIGARDNGRVLVSDISVSVLGLSRSMIDSLLEMAYTLALRQRDHRLAMRLFERVACEDTQYPVQIAALRGYARGAMMTSGNNQRRIEAMASELAEKIRASRVLGRGEEAFLTGLAFAASNNRSLQMQAVKYFAKAIAESEATPEDYLDPEPTYYIGPFEARDTSGLYEQFPPETEFMPDANYPGKNGLIGWRKPAEASNDGNPVVFPGSFSNHEFTVYYVRQVFRSREALEVQIQTGSDDGIRMWVNNELRLDKNVKRSIKPNSERTVAYFRKGRNVILLKIHNRESMGGFSLRVIPKPNTYLGVFGHLAKLEEALVFLRIGDTEGAKKRFVEMQRTGALEYIVRRYPEVLKTGSALATVLEHVDDILNKKSAGQLASAWSLLEAMRSLYPDHGKDLSLRYYHLADIHSKAGRYDEADAAYLQAIAQAPDWYLPRFDRAVHLFNNGKREEAEKELVRATNDLPESFDLQIAIAKFYLKQRNENLVYSSLAYSAASKALRISEEKNATAWELASRALFADSRLAMALNAVEKSIELENTPERQKLESEIRDAFEAENASTLMPLEPTQDAIYQNE